jgi:hypothetical protein
MNTPCGALKLSHHTAMDDRIASENSMVKKAGANSISTHIPIDTPLDASLNSIMRFLLRSVSAAFRSPYDIDNRAGTALIIAGANSYARYEQSIIPNWSNV